MKRLFTHFTKTATLLFLLVFGAGNAWSASADPLNGICGRKVQYNTDSANLQWRVDTVQHTLIITGSGRMKDYDTDTKAPWYPWRDYIQTATFPNGMTTVGSYAMYYLQQLTSVNWGGNTVVHIYDRAFYYCTALTQLNLPNSVTTIWNYAFNNCTALMQITWSNSLQYIYKNAFTNCSSLTQLTFPNSLRYITEYAFSSCSNLTYVKFGDNVSNIDRYAFQSCSKIEEIDFGRSPVSISYDVFNPASSLKTIKSKGIKFIGSRAFSDCTQLVHLELGDSIISIDDYAFNRCYSLPAIHFPSTITTFTPLAFCYCYSLDTITMHADNPKYDSRNNGNAVFVTATNTLHFGCCKSVIPLETSSIGNSAFYYCKRLQSVSLPEGLQSIQGSAFYHCDSLITVTLPEGLTSLGDHAFAECLRLQSINLPNSVTNISCGILLGCDSITVPVYNTTYFAYLPAKYSGSYVIPGTPEKIACEAFKNCKQLTAVTIPSSVTEVNSSAFHDCINLQSAPLPNGLTMLGEMAYYNCNSLASITIPERIKKIWPSTFYYCSTLPTIIIPDSVTHIYEKAFQNCKSLISITFPAELTYLGGNIINGCTSLSDIHWNVRTYSGITVNSSSYDPFNGMRSQITSFTFGDSVHVIPANLCAKMTNLTAISLGASIETIGNSAFSGCNKIDSIHWNLRTYNDPYFYTDAPFYYLRNQLHAFTFGDSVRYIPAYLCHSMSQLRQLRFPKNVASIGKFAFRYINALDSISIDEDNLYYDSRNDCNALIETDSDVLLLGCYKTQIPDDITGVGDCAFHNVQRLYSVELPESTTFVGKEAFNGCHDLKALTLSDNIVTIDDYAFQNCDSLPHVTIPQNVETIGFRAFAHCSGLEEIACQPSVPPTIDETSFSGTTCPIRVPCAFIGDYRSAPVWAGLGNRVAGEYFFTLTITPNEFSYGVVTMLQKPDCEHDAIIEASPSRGCRFVEWQDENGLTVSPEARYEFTLEEDLNLIAVFERTSEGIDEAVDENSSAIWYDIMGHRVSQPSSGVYIVVTGNEVHKVLIP